MVSFSTAYDNMSTAAPAGWSTITGGSTNAGINGVQGGSNVSNVWVSGYTVSSGKTQNSMVAKYQNSITGGIAVDGGSLAVLGNSAGMYNATALYNASIEGVGQGTIVRGIVGSSGAIFAGAITSSTSGAVADQIKGSGTALDPVVASGGYALVGGGGSNFVIKGYYVNGSGGLMSGGTFNPGSLYGIGNGGSAVGGTVGGMQAVFSNGSSINQLFAGTDSLQNVVSNGLSLNATVISNGRILNSGGTTSGALISKGTITVSGGTYVSWLNAGYEAVLGSYGTATSYGDIIDSGSTEVVGKDGIASRSTVLSGGTGLVSSGGTTISPLISGGTEIVSNSGTIISGMVTSSGGITLSSGGYGTVLSAYAGGSVQVSSGGTGSSITAASGGTALVLSGGSAGHLLVTSSGTATLASGAIIYSGATINNSGGSLVLSSGATADYLVASSGTAVENAGATLGGLYAASGGTGLAAQSGAVVSSAIAGYDPNNTSASGGTVILSNGATASTIGAVAGGTLVLGSGATASGFSPISGGTATLLAGAQVVSGATAQVLGRGSTAGYLSIDSGNTVTEIDVGSRGTVTLTSGASVGLLSAGTSGIVSLSGATASSIILSGATASISGQASVQTLSAIAGATGLFSSGASLNSVFLSSGKATFTSGAYVSQLTIMSGASGVFLAGASVQNVSVGAGGWISGVNITNNNTLAVASGGTSIGATITYDSGSYFSNPYTMLSSGAYVSGATIVGGDGTATGAASLGGLLTIASGATLLNTSMGYNARLLISGLKYSNSGSAWVDSNNTVHVLENGTSWVMALSGTYDTSSGSFILDDDGQGNTVLIYQKCFLAGSMIRTPKGEKAVERLRKGDQITIWQDGREEIRDITAVTQRRARVDASQPEDMAGWSVIVAQGAFGPGLPSKDLSVTPEHCFFFEGRFVPVRMLINGSSIRYDHSQTEYDYYHVKTEPHAIIWANGVLTESWLDTEKKDEYKPDGTGAMRLVESEVTDWAHNAAAPLEVGQAFVKPLHDRFAERATELGLAAPKADSATAGETTMDPAPYIQLENGTVIQPQRHEAGRYVFILPAYARLVTIGSRQFRPSETEGPYLDDRRVLGMLVGQVSVWTGGKETIITRHLTDDTLAGWDVLEAGPHRWTRGKAKLPLHDGPVTGTNQQILSIEVQAGGPYKLDSQNGNR